MRIEVFDLALVRVRSGGQAPSAGGTVAWKKEPCHSKSWSVCAWGTNAVNPLIRTVGQEEEGGSPGVWVWRYSHE